MKNTNTTKTTWIGAFAIVIAAIISGIFLMIHEDPKEGKSISTSITSNDSSKNIVTNNQNDINGDFVNGDKIVVNKKESKDLEYSKIDAPKALIVTQNQTGDNTLNVTQISDSYATSNGGNYIKEISYPRIGEFGINILDRDTNFNSAGTYSMAALIPKNQYVIVKVSGAFKDWGFPVFQSIPGWRTYDFKNSGDTISRKFKTVKYGTVDLELYLHGGEIKITVYENNSETEVWRKTIKLDDKVEAN